MNNENRAKLLLAAIITLGFFGTVAITIFVPTQTGMRDILLVLIGALVGSFKEVTGYYFGSSLGNVTANATIREMVVQPPLMLPGATPTPTGLPAALEAALPPALDATLPAALDAALADPVPVQVMSETAKVRAQFPPPSAS